MSDTESVETLFKNIEFEDIMNAVPKLSIQSKFEAIFDEDDDDNGKPPAYSSLEYLPLEEAIAKKNEKRRLARENSTTKRGMSRRCHACGLRGHNMRNQKCPRFPRSKLKLKPSPYPIMQLPPLSLPSSIEEIEARLEGTFKEDQPTEKMEI
jgi:hypothetical protein